MSKFSSWRKMSSVKDRRVWRWESSFIHPNSYNSFKFTRQLYSSVYRKYSMLSEYLRCLFFFCSCFHFCWRVKCAEMPKHLHKRCVKVSETTFYDVSCVVVLMRRFMRCFTVSWQNMYCDDSNIWLEIFICIYWQSGVMVTWLLWLSILLHTLHPL